MVQQDSGEWGAVCGLMGFTDADAAVVCRQLGLPWSGARGCSGYCQDVLYQNAGPGTVLTAPFVVSAVQCTGDEEQISDCPHFKGIISGWGNMGSTGCDRQDAGGWVN